ncbi:glycosyltransferase 87 family protein [Rhodococcus sp. AQ5-07]|uniref:glycosyltransferase 87 family protein n=1 Tax=Rhodococcus sp. AQ5-07 TaxID=2054902 RepID=UPI000DBF5AA5|nr:glycosyltransferase 87 family protein [Rhodococcus sp. AQ5-07]RAL36702.1 glycosyl transferase [Rhodococcus sp. AQ5-07]
MPATRVEASRIVTIGSLIAAGVAALCYLVYSVRAVEPVDFLVYRYAAQAFAAGSNIYESNLVGPLIVDEGMPFTYTPFAVIFLWPTVLFDWWTAYLLWSALCIAAVVWTVAKFTPARVPKRPLVMAALVLAVSVTPIVSAHISFGQVNLVLMVLVLLDVTRRGDSRFGRWFPRGLLIGVAAAIKLTPALFIVYFVVTKQWRLAIWSSIGFAAATAVAAMVDPAVSWTFWSDVVWNLSDRVDLSGQAIASAGNSSLQGGLAALGTWTASLAMPLTVLCAAVALWVARDVYRVGRAVDAALVIGLSAPILSPISWIHHWVYLVPAAVTVLFRLRSPLQFGAAAVGLAVVYCGPSMGQQFIETSPLLLPLGLVLREGFLIVTLVLILALWRLPTTAPEWMTGRDSEDGADDGSEDDKAPDSAGNQGPSCIEAGFRTRSSGDR